MSKLAMSLGVVVCLCVGLIFFTKWYQRKYKLTEMSTEMKIVAQHHLGPKKQLAVVRVSGEFILLGITDQNINMIKTLSLIDDEFPEANSQSFVDSLNQQDQFSFSESKKVADSTQKKASSSKSSDKAASHIDYDSIKDRVSKRLNTMRSI